MRKFSVCLLAACLGTAALVAQTRPAARSLDIYVVDVEGGAGVLYVPAGGESLLIDTGNGGAAGARDAMRIAAAAKDAGLTQIDHLVTTHWHGDHFGGMSELVKLVPVKNFYDHGENVQPAAAADEFLTKVYPAIHAQGKRTVVKPGDKVPVTGLDVRVVTSAGQAIKAALPGVKAAANSYCADFMKQADDPSENAQSVGMMLQFGRFRIAHIGDLTWNKEGELMCPQNMIGTADLFIVSHHGQAVSNSPVLVNALQPRVSIINNGTRKGGQPDAMRVLLNSPRLEDVWQLHFSLLSGQEYTVPGMFIANTFDDQSATMPVAPWTPPPQGQQAPPAPQHNGPAFYIKDSAQQDGTFSVTNMRNNFTKTYRGAMGTN
ncbi:MAG: ComEC/Rec2 family competence protein [Vicinamibacterales bacterium]